MFHSDARSDLNSHGDREQQRCFSKHHKHTTTACVYGILRGRWSQGSTFGCQLETLATPQRELTKSQARGHTSKIEKHKTHDHGNMLLTMA